jgi:conjugative transposon TraN protein
MKHILFTLLVIFTLSAHAQDHIPSWPDIPYFPREGNNPEAFFEHLEPQPQNEITVRKDPAIQPQMTVVQLPVNLDVHFISPEPIQYVDISAKNIIGDLPLKNVLRIRYKDSSKTTEAVVTIAGEKFIAQYHIRPGGTNVPLQINIEPADTKPLDISGIGLSQNQLKKLAYDLFLNSTHKLIGSTSAFGLKAGINHIYSAGDYLFLDISYKNKTNLKYDIGDFRFTIEDKKVTKATNVQSVEIKPELALFDVPSFSKYYRNIFVLKKMSFPGNKVLNIELSEKQISSRVITLTISYKDVLSADTVPI